MADRKNKTTYDRLYDLDRDKQMKLKEKADNEKSTIKYEIKERQLDKTLYEDAERRRRDMDKMRADVEKSRVVV